MSEWWTYRLSDFLMFSPRTYWRLVELYNRDVWPAQIFALGAGLVLLWLTAAGRRGSGRVVAASLAAAWLWVGWAFHWQRYATINLAAPYLAAAFGLEAALLILPGMLPRADHDSGESGSARIAGMAVAVCGLLLYPLAVLPAGRPWTQAEVFGLMPEPTALATLGLLLAGRQPHRAWLCIVPALSFMVGMATLGMISA